MLAYIVIGFDFPANCAVVLAFNANVPALPGTGVDVRPCVCDASPVSTDGIDKKSPAFGPGF
jgi:hypothetical protein